MILLDTCALVELTKKKPAFSAKTYDMIRQQCCMLSISFAEIHCKIKAGKLSFGSNSAYDLYDDVKSTANMNIVNDMSPCLWFSAIDLNWETDKKKPDKDPADRLILAYAMSRNLPTATTDKMMHKLYGACHW